ncbi:hypothetical protein BX666DRAFT_2118419 [Dichotomocladium elegans]|nr:hypothetical protein BX666DRAFT_2118419 [Dichotomocladium elegans]
MGIHATKEMDHQLSFLKLDTVFQSTGDSHLDSFLRSPDGLDSFMASLPHDQQKSFLEDDMFTPMMSPETTPSIGYFPSQNMNQPREVDITPLTSPAIMPQPTHLTPGDIYEQYEQLERAKQMITRRLSELQKKRPREEVSPAATCHQDQDPYCHRRQAAQFQHESPSVSTNVPLSPAESPSIEPATIASLMKNIPAPAATVATAAAAAAAAAIPPSPPPAKRTRRVAAIQHDHTPSPRPLKPLLVSPTLGPGPPNAHDVEHHLATKSNYQNLMEGKAIALGISFSSSIKSGLEVRRTAHKAAEQKRRDSLKEWFDRLRHEVHEGYVKKNVPSDELEDDTKPLSKVLLLRYAYDYIALLKSSLAERDLRINELEQQLDRK